MVKESKRHSKSPEVAPSGLFYAVFWRGGLILRLVTLLVFAQPFANAVGHHTCHDGHSKTGEGIQGTHLLPVPVSEVVTAHYNML
jgi:hypothetical protein